MFESQEVNPRSDFSAKTSRKELRTMILTSSMCLSGEVRSEELRGQQQPFCFYFTILGLISVASMT